MQSVLTGQAPTTLERKTTSGGKTNKNTQNNTHNKWNSFVYLKTKIKRCASTRVIFIGLLHSFVRQHANSTNSMLLLYTRASNVVSCVWRSSRLSVGAFRSAACSTAGVICPGRGDAYNSPWKIYTSIHVFEPLEPHQFRDITASGTLASLVYMILLIDDVWVVGNRRRRKQEGNGRGRLVRW